MIRIKLIKKEVFKVPEVPKVKNNLTQIKDLNTKSTG